MSNVQESNFDRLIRSVHRTTLTIAILAIGLGRQLYFNWFPSLKNKEDQSGEKSTDATFICPVCGAELEEIGWWCPCFDDRPDSYPRDISDIT